MPGVNDYCEPKTAQHHRGSQAVLNESWPLSDKAGGHARGIEDQPDPIDVEVRIEWADDGEEWLRGRAHRWTKSQVFVRFVDPRSLTGFVWVRAQDVRRIDWAGIVAVKGRSGAGRRRVGLGSFVTGGIAD